MNLSNIRLRTKKDRFYVDKLMPRCPECSEPVQKGQTHCFACDSDFVLPPAKSHFLKGNTVFVAAVAGGCIIAVALAVFITQPKVKAPPSASEPIESTNPLSRTSTPIKPKEAPRVNDVATLSQQLAELESKVANIEKRSLTEEFTKDEKDALRFTQNLILEMKSSLQSIKNTKKTEDQRRLIRQFRVKQNEVESFLVILKKRF
jgi:hypothetical protein